MNKWNTLFWEIMAELPLTNWVFTIFRVVWSFCPHRTSICHSFTLLLSQVNFPFTVLKTEDLFEPIWHLLLWSITPSFLIAECPRGFFLLWWRPEDQSIVVKGTGSPTAGRKNWAADWNSQDTVFRRLQDERAHTILWTSRYKKFQEQIGARLRLLDKPQTCWVNLCGFNIDSFHCKL